MPLPPYAGHRSLASMVEKTAYDLTEAESALLTAATRNAMGEAGALGGAVVDRSVGGLFTARAGAAGGRFGARFTRPMTAAATLEVPHDPEAVREQARASIAEDGAVIEDPNGAGDGSVWGLVGSGASNMVPAMVRVHIEATDAGGSRVDVRATGREGLIKQRIAAKAVDRVCEAISRRPGPLTP